jgi:hypothetical protein
MGAWAEIDGMLQGRYGRNYVILTAAEARWAQDAVSMLANGLPDRESVARLVERARLPEGPTSADVFEMDPRDLLGLALCMALSILEHDPDTARLREACWGMPAPRPE